MSKIVDEAIKFMRNEPGMSRLATAVSALDEAPFLEKHIAAENALGEACLAIVALSWRIRKLEEKADDGP